MILKDAISRAIEGGWKPRGMKPHKRFEFEIDQHVVFTDKVNVYRMSFEAIALNPSFWQALGKALGWEQDFEDHEGKVQPNGEWVTLAHEFYDLILTGGDTKKFWNDILG